LVFSAFTKKEVNNQNDKHEILIPRPSLN